MSQQVQFVEVHGNDGTSHKVVAEHFVQREFGGVVSRVEPSGMRCAHGAIVWRVIYEDGEDR